MIQDEIAGRKMIFFVLWLSMAAACIIYYVIPMLVSLPVADDQTSLLIFVYMLTPLSIIQAFAGFYFLWKFAAPAADDNSWRYIERAQKGFIIGLAIFEAIAIYGLTMRFVGLLGYHQWFIAAGFVLIIIGGTRIGPIFSHYQNLKDIEDAGGKG